MAPDGVTPRALAVVDIGFAGDRRSRLLDGERRRACDDSVVGDEVIGLLESLAAVEDDGKWADIGRGDRGDSLKLANSNNLEHIYLGWVLVDALYTTLMIW